MPKGRDEKAKRQQRILAVLGTFTNYPHGGGMTVSQIIEALGEVETDARKRSVQRDMNELAGPRGPLFDSNAKPALPNERQAQILRDAQPDIVVHGERQVWYAGDNPRYYGYRADKGAALESDFRGFADYDLRHYAAMLLPPEVARTHIASVEQSYRGAKGLTKELLRWRSRVADRAMMRHAARRIDEAIRAAVYLALYRSKMLEIAYEARKGDPTKTHVIAPLGLVLDIGRTTLLARRPGKTSAIYKFHLHRIREATALEENIDPAIDDAFDMSAYLESGDVDFNVSGSSLLEIEAVLLNDKAPRGILEDEPIAPNQRFERDSNGMLVVRATAVDTWALRRKLLTYLPYVVFRKPCPIIPPYDEHDDARARSEALLPEQRIFAEPRPRRSPIDEDG